MGERSRLDDLYARAAGLTAASKGKVAGEGGAVSRTEHDRELVVRWERGEIFRALRELRRERDRAIARQRPAEAAAARAQLQAFHERAQAFERQLDELNRQANEQVHMVEFETPELGRHRAPVVELDLAPPRQGMVDERTPTVFVGGIATSPHQQLSLAMALALSGRRVLAVTYPEHSAAGAPPDWTRKLQEATSYRAHAGLVREVVKSLDLKRVNLVGFSMGGGIALEAAADPELRERVDELVVAEPVGLQERSWPELASFTAKQFIGRMVLRPEAAVKTWRQGNERGGAPPEAMRADIELLRHRRVTPTTLAAISPAQRYEVWVGRRSPIVEAGALTATLREVEAERQQRSPATAGLTVRVVDTADHNFPLMRALGLAARWRVPGAGEPRRDGDVVVTAVSEDELDHSVTALIERQDTLTG